MPKRGRGKVGALFIPKMSRGLNVGAKVACTDNSGAKIVEIVSVIGYKGRLNRLASATVGDMAVVSVKSGTPEMRRQVLRAIIVRQKKPFRRPNGYWIQFEDNAAVITNPEGQPKGTEIRGPIAKEAAERWSRLASVATTII
ncbi:MAG: 50S ribosomal protein L14 [Candidatus Freyarchaeota archaeon]|jgi:large subunit ribosomal protein L14|nr:50S ribosomal protein L14 [Candidatus Jordarchaeia archaeon]MBS7279496.1 50S ribosomal protein L14 [Candidatus Jordarchaeia archaeon]